MPSILNDWLHLVSGALWLGGIGLLVLLWWPVVRFTRRGSRVAIAREVLAPFGRVATGAFLVAVATGLVSLVDPARPRRRALGHRVRAAAGGQDRGRRPDRGGELPARAAAAAAVGGRRARRRRSSGATGRCGAASRGSGSAVVAAVAGLVAFPLPPRQLDQAGQAQAAVCDPCPLPRPAADELGVADSAGSSVVAGWIRRSADAVTGTVRLLDSKGKPAQVPVELPGARASSCGVGCRRFRLPPSATGVEVAVRERGRRYATTLPATWDRAGNRRARDMLRRAERTMRALRGVRELERLSSGPGTGATTEYRLRAPDRLAWHTGRGVESVVIGRRQWIRQPGIGWREQPYGSGLAFKTRTWFAWSRYAREVRLLGERREGGRRVAVLALMDEGTPVWFRLTVDLATHRVVAERMAARARFIDTRFVDFGERFRIEAPR